VTHHTTEQRFDTVVIGGGQAGLAMGYFLAQQQRDFVILEAADRIGETWRNRWDSLRLFTPAFHNGLPGMPLPPPRGYFPSKDETADYLQAYATTFGLPVRLGRHVDVLTRHGDGYLITADDERYLTDHAVVATGPYRHPRIPEFASALDPAITQLHSSGYRNPRQLPDAGDVLVVGAGNSGAEIAVELAASRTTFLSGRDTGAAPLRLIHNRLTLWLAAHLLTVDTRLGQMMRRAGAHRGDPLVRLNRRAIAAAGVQRVPRVEAIADCRPRLADGRTLDVAAVIWATGFDPDLGWIQLPIFDDRGYPIHHRGVVAAAPGLYFLGLPFQHSPTSTHVGGVGKDARYIAEHLAAGRRHRVRGGLEDPQPAPAVEYRPRGPPRASVHANSKAQHCHGQDQHEHHGQRVAQEQLALDQGHLSGPAHDPPPLSVVPRPRGRRPRAWAWTLRGRAAPVRTRPARAR
jgi:putative flavoprotein involved in K+ transport